MAHNLGLLFTFFSYSSVVAIVVVVVVVVVYLMCIASQVTWVAQIVDRSLRCWVCRRS